MSQNILKRDLWPIGLVIGIILPILFFAILFAIDYAIFQLWARHLTERFDYIFLLSITANLFPIRHYLVNLKFEKTGMGILLATIAEIVIYFFMYYQP
jgi:hypothetical protein